MTTVVIETKTCLVCGKSSRIEVNQAAYNRWMRGMVIQEAFPDMPPAQREVLITGTHDECWNEMTSPE